MKKTVKRTMCALLAAVSLATTGTTAFAGTIPFQRENSNIYTSEAYLSSSNAGVTQKRLCESSNRQNYGIRELLSVMQNGNYYGGRCILLP